jgi:hypothetical protein
MRIGLATAGRAPGKEPHDASIVAKSSDSAFVVGRAATPPTQPIDRIKPPNLIKKIVTHRNIPRASFVYPLPPQKEWTKK